MDAIGPIGLNYKQMCERIESEFFRALSTSSADTDIDINTDQNPNLNDTQTEISLDDEILDAGQVTSAAVFNAPIITKIRNSSDIPPSSGYLDCYESSF